MGRKVKQEDMPEVLEYLKSTRTLIRQMKLFVKVPTNSETKEVLLNATNRLKQESEAFIEIIEGEKS